MRTCFTFMDGAWPIKLEQSPDRKFRVSYGMQVKSGLSYSQAAMELGACLMHSAACEGDLDNNTEEE